MLLRERAGPLSDSQRRLLEEADKSCGRLSALIGEMSDLGQLLDGRQPLATGATDLAALLREVGANIRPGDNQPPVVIEPGTDRLIAAGDPAWLRRVIESLVFALRREIMDDSTLIVSGGSRPHDSGRVGWITFGTPGVSAALGQASRETLEPFDEWRGGCGLTLPLARLVIEMHGGRLLALTPKAAQALTGRTDRVTAPDEGDAPKPKQAGGVLELPLIGRS
jgi:K+-sensing histidine kinase KdpD